MEHLMTAMLRHLLYNLKAHLNMVLAFVCSNVRIDLDKRDHFYGKNFFYGLIGRSLCDLTFV